MRIFSDILSKLTALVHTDAATECHSEASDYVVVHEVVNDTEREMRVFLEMTCEEIFLAPGQRMQLLAKPSEDLLPLTVTPLQDGLQIFPNRQFDPDWHIRFKGKLIKPGYPTRLAELE